MLAMPIFNAGRTQAINDIAASGQTEALLRYEDTIVRALEDVENALVALGGDRLVTRTCAPRPRRPIPRSATPARSIARGQVDLLAAARCTARAARREARPKRQPFTAPCATRPLYKALGGGWQPFEP